METPNTLLELYQMLGEVGAELGSDMAATDPVLVVVDPDGFSSRSNITGEKPCTTSREPVPTSGKGR